MLKWSSFILKKKSNNVKHSKPTVNFLPTQVNTCHFTRAVRVTPLFPSLVLIAATSTLSWDKNGTLRNIRKL